MRVITQLSSRTAEAVSLETRAFQTFTATLPFLPSVPCTSRNGGPSTPALGEDARVGIYQRAYVHQQLAKRERMQRQLRRQDYAQLRYEGMGQSS